MEGLGDSPLPLVLTKENGDSSPKPNKPSQEKILLEPYEYILQIPGKMVRAKLSQKVKDVDIPEYILHCGLKYQSKGMWTQVTKVTRVFRDKFPKDAQYDTVISVIRQEYNLNPDASHCLVDMQNRIVDRHDFSIVSYVHNNRKYVGATRIYAFNHWLKIPDEILHVIMEVTQMLHNASLLIDDIEDSSQLRRGIPVAHNIYGVAHTINSANFVYFLGLEKAMTLKHPAVTKVFTEQVLELHRGQGMDIYWRDAFICPTEEEYKLMVIRKTGGLFGLAVRLMQLFSQNQSNLKPLLDNLGLYFQIRDDYANLSSKEYEANKSYAEDLTEGKFSFPIIHGISSKPDNQQILSILRQRTTNLEVKKYCVDYLEKIGSFEYTKTVLVELELKLGTQIEELGGNPHLTGLIAELKKIYRHSEES